MSSSIRFAAAAALCLAALVACTQSPQQKPSREIPALVNGAPITRGEVDRAVKALISQSRMAKPIAPEVMKKATETALDQLISAELLYQAAAEMKVPDLERQVRDRMAQSRAGYRTQEEYDKALKSVEMSQKDVELAVRKDIAINHLIVKLFLPKASVSEAEIKKFYQENREKGLRLDEARGEIASYLQQAKVRKAVAEYAAQLRANAQVEKI